METVIVVEQHSNQRYGRVKSHGSARFGSFSPRDFRGINCRSFESRAGILPTPMKASASETKKAYPSSPKTPSARSNSNSENGKQLMSVRSAPIPINTKFSNKINCAEEFCSRSFSFSELWAGPAYSNSPPPSSLPLPKFSVRPKRTTSLELPRSAPEFEMRPPAKSAPASPTREHNFSSGFSFHSADSATRTLRRILNLDIDNE